MGWSNSPPLPTSKEDINYIYQQIHKSGIRFDAIYASSLDRAQQTANAYAKLFGVAEVIAAPELKEVNYGILQSRQKSWVYKNYPEHKKNPDFVYPEGESFQQMRERSVRFLSKLSLEQPEMTVMIVSHAGVIRATISYFLGLNYSTSLKQKVPFRYIGDFRIEEERCVQYDELGTSSGFVKDGTIQIPFSGRASSQPV